VKELVYDCDREKLGPALAARFLPLSCDEETERWVATWQPRPHGVFTTTLMRLLGRFATSYDVHGLLRAYPMHLLSERAWGELLGGRVRALLDVGAGAGYVTERASGFCEELCCTETSHALQKRLRERGLTIYPVDLTVQPLEREFDVISCLNVLDRTAEPLTLLRSLVGHLRSEGRLIVSIPLPPSPHVHVKGGTVAQRERLPSVASDWETAARELSERLFPAAGLEVLRLARTPYLSRGDRAASLYVLDAAIWLLRVSPDSSVRPVSSG